MTTAPFPQTEPVRSLPRERYLIKVGFLRLVARIVDFFLALGIVLAPPSNESLEYINTHRAVQIAIAVLIQLVAATLEAATASRFGTTPGKWLFALELRKIGGSLPTFGTAFKRYFVVYAVGEALMIPLLNFLAVIYHLRTFSRESTTYWDREFATEVTWHGPKWKRLLITVVVVVLFDRLTVYLLRP